MGTLRSIINSQLFLSDSFDKLLPPLYKLDGNRHFLDEFLPGFIRDGMTVIDVGGGKQPYFGDPSYKLKRRLTVIGLDISQAELDLAPRGCYDSTICGDISTYRSSEPVADLVICQAVLEHVQNVEGAFRALASLVKSGGRALIFVPSGNAVFARLNLMLPESLKRRLLFGIYPEMRRAQGFPSFYNRCTPGEFSGLAHKCGFTVEHEKLYWMSAYFRFFAPLHVLWRVWLLTFRTVSPRQSAETFSLALRKL